VVFLSLAMVFLYPMFPFPKAEDTVTWVAFTAAVKDVGGNIKLAVVYNGIVNEDDQNFDEVDVSNIKIMTISDPRGDAREDVFWLSGKMQPFDRVFIDIPDDAEYFSMYYDDGETEYLISKGIQYIGSLAEAPE
jgi:hypothetical protein